LQVGKKGGSMMVRVIWIGRSCDRKLLEASDMGFFFQNIWEISMVVAKTNSEWDL
jgi:hypothetical protein